MPTTPPDLHPTDVRLLDALERLRAGGGRVTDLRLAAASGVGRRTVKKRRLRLARRGLWPLPPRYRETPPAIAARVRELHAGPDPPVYAAIAARVAAESGRTISAKTVWRILARVGSHGRPPSPLAGLAGGALHAAVRAAERADRRRHDPDAPEPESVAAILARLRAGRAEDASCR